MLLGSLFSATSLHQLFPRCHMPGFWLNLIFLRNSNTQLRLLSLKVLLCTNKLCMKLCPSIVSSAMFLGTLISSAPKLLLIQKLYPALNHWFQLFKLIKGLFLVDWVLSHLFSPLLLCKSCKTSRTTRTYPHRL